jgi:quercetin dioxygenase-like cupin family protein
MEITSSAESEPTEAVEGVHLSLLADGKSMNVQRFEIEPGAEVPEHSHPHEQAGVVVEGQLTFVLEDGTERTVGPGDSYSLASDEVHGAENRGEVRVVGYDVFSPPRTEPDWKD